MTIETIYPRVAKIIADVLAIDESDIALNKRLIQELGAESIDFLDLTFQLEREFGIKIPRGQIEKEVRENLKDKPFEKDGFITPEGIQTLKNYMPEVPAAFFPEKLKTNQIPTLLTVESLCQWVLRAQTKKMSEEAVSA